MVMRADAGLHADPTRRQIGEPGLHLTTRPLLPSTMAPRWFWPTMWNEFLPISMPITAGEVSRFCDMACSLSSVPPASICCWQGRSTAGPFH
jgi:hypothetical protein